MGLKFEYRKIQGNSKAQKAMRFEKGEHNKYVCILRVSEWVARILNILVFFSVLTIHVE